MFAKSLPARGRCRVGARVKSKMKRNCQRCPFGATAEQQNSRTAAAQVPLLQSIQLDRHTHTYGRVFASVCVCAMSCVCVWLNGLFTLITKIWQMFARLMSRSVCVCANMCVGLCACVWACVCVRACVWGCRCVFLAYARGGQGALLNCLQLCRVPNWQWVNM